MKERSVDSRKSKNKNTVKDLVDSKKSSISFNEAKDSSAKISRLKDSKQSCHPYFEKTQHCYSKDGDAYRGLLYQ